MQNFGTTDPLCYTATNRTKTVLQSPLWKCLASNGTCWVNWTGKHRLGESVGNLGWKKSNQEVWKLPRTMSMISTIVSDTFVPLSLSPCSPTPIASFILLKFRIAVLFDYYFQLILWTISRTMSRIWEIIVNISGQMSRAYGYFFY